MKQFNSINMTIEAELRTEAATAQIIRREIPEANDYILRSDDIFFIDLSLTPRQSNARACYPNHWGTHRLERIGELFLIPPGEVMHIKSGSGRQTSIVCRLAPRLMSAWFDADMKWNQSRLTAALDIHDDSIRCLMMRLTREVSHRGVASDILLDLIASQLAIELGRYCDAADDLITKKGLPTWRLKLIEERVREPGKSPSLAELAALCGLSVRQLSRGFRVSRGCSIGNYVERCRIETAKRLLTGGESVKAVAFSMGFASLSSFSYAFRRATGTCPRQFRQRA